AFSRYPRVRHVDPPLWWTEGLAEYFSAGEDSRDEMILRDLTLSGRLPALGDLMYAAGGIVYPLGGAIHHFLAATYGEWRIDEMYRDVWKYGSFEDEVRVVYGRTLGQLSDEWQYWMRQRYYPAVVAAEPLSITAHLLTRLAIKPAVFGPPGRLERLTSDHYQDLDPTVSPDGRTVVFSSDRTPFGPRGARNLFTLDFASGTISYLTYGDWHDDQPRSTPDGRIFFASDRDG